MIVFVFFLLSSLAAVYAQIESPIAPPEVVQDRASEVKRQESSTACDEACAALASSLPSSVFLAKSGNFKFWDNKQSDLTPACRVEPSSSEAVSVVLKTVIDAKCHFAIKSGGHDRSPGSSNADGGVTIDLVRLNRVDVAKDRKSVKIGAGLRWLDVYTALEKDGLLVVGGRVHDVGVGGLLLGGGISFFSNRKGWACDNVLSFEIVLPDTTIKTVTQSSMPELYRSLRGAGASNFGIITAFTLEAFEQLNPAGLWGGSKAFPWDKVPELLQLRNIFTTESMDATADVAMINTFLYFQAYNTWWGMSIFHHTSHTDSSSWPESFQPYQQLEGVPDTTRVGIKPHSNTTIDMGAASPVGDRNIYGTLTYRPSIELEQKILDVFREELTPILDVPELVPVVVLQPLSRTMIKQMRTRGGNALGIADDSHPEPGPLTILSVSWKWTHAADDARLYAAYYRFIAGAESAAQAMGLLHPFKYINYAEQTQDVWSGYGAKSLESLRKVQRQVDPDGVFAKTGLSRGYFKLNDGDAASSSAYDSSRVPSSSSSSSTHHPDRKREL